MSEGSGTDTPGRFVYRRREDLRSEPRAERDHVRLEDMRQLYRAAAQLVAGTDEQHFLSDAGFLDRLTATGILVHLGEAARNLSTEFTAAHSEVDWAGLIGLRNRVAHDYLAVDYRIVWRALTRNFPAEARALGLEPA